MSKRTHFGYQLIDEKDKAGRVASVFHSVSSQYDLMNDLMSLGMHRLWKAFTVSQVAIRPGFYVLDVASGTGDLASALAKRAGDEGQVWMTDINESMLQAGRDKLLNKGVLLPVALCDAEKLPFPDNYFDRVIVSFGLRNMTRKDVALSEMRRVLKRRGKLLILEFSSIWKPLQKVYDIHAFVVLPWLGKYVVKDENSYRYLAESIKMHPDQESLQKMMENAGFLCVNYFNLSAGIVALHTGMKG